jgi:hypothetical protein
MKELIYAERTKDKNALLQRILDAAGDIQNKSHILEDVIVSIICCAQMCIQVAGRHFKQIL